MRPNKIALKSITLVFFLITVPISGCASPKDNENRPKVILEYTVERPLKEDIATVLDGLSFALARAREYRQEAFILPTVIVHIMEKNK